MSKISIFLIFPVILLGSDTLTVSNLTVSSGQEYDVSTPGTLGTSGPVLIESGGDSIFVGELKVTLRDGFSAQDGALFWAFTDHDLDGYPDTLDSDYDGDSDGLPDSWEIFWFGSIDAAGATGSGDPDNDSVPNVDEMLLDMNPTNHATIGNLDVYQWHTP
ncbi:MAG: hypothetical protein ACFE0O_15465 [Opitutales bacterium]